MVGGGAEAARAVEESVPCGVGGVSGAISFLIPSAMLDGLAHRRAGLPGRRGVGCWRKRDRGEPSVAAPVAGKETGSDSAKAAGRRQELEQFIVLHRVGYRIGSQRYRSRRNLEVQLQGHKTGRGAHKIEKRLLSRPGDLIWFRRRGI